MFLILSKEAEELMMKIVVLTSSLLHFLFGISYAGMIILLILQCYTDLEQLQYLHSWKQLVSLQHNTIQHNTTQHAQQSSTDFLIKFPFLFLVALAGSRDFAILRNVQTGSGTHTAFFKKEIYYTDSIYSLCKHKLQNCSLNQTE